MSLTRKQELLKNTEEVINLILEVWDNQDSLIVSLENQNITYISVCDDLNDSYHGQGWLVRSKNYSSIHYFVSEIKNIFQELIQNLNSENNELYLLLSNLISKLNELSPNLE